MSPVLSEPQLLIDVRQPTRVDGYVADGVYAAFTAPYPEATGPNQDCALIAPTSGGGVLAVADGLGGAPAGHDASRLAVEHLRRCLVADSDLQDARTPILDAFESANAAIRELSVGAATTLAVVELRDRVLRPYHVGDSSILVCGSRGKVKFLSLSHSPVGYGVEAGLIDANEALHHEELNLVSNTLGTSSMRIELGTPFALAEQDTVLLGTDGLFDNLHLAEIIDVIRAGALDAAADELARQATARMVTPSDDKPSKPDDLTFVLYRPLRPSQVMPSR